MLQDGPHGLGGTAVQLQPAVDEEVPDVSTYGIDWAVAGNPSFMNHLLQNNPQDHPEGNPFAVRLAKLSDVPCEPPGCPFTIEQVRWLDDELVSQSNTVSRNMEVQRLVWTEALRLCAFLTSSHTNLHL